MTLSPLNSLHKESQAPVVTANKVFPIRVWVHVGCEITSDCIRLHYDGDIVGEMPLKFSSSLKNMSLSALEGDIGKSKCYFHSIEVLSPASSMKDHLIKPQVEVKSFPSEPIKPLISHREGTYLVGGGVSGYIYIWEVSTGILLKKWQGHYIAVSRIIFSDDQSLLISGAEDGSNRVWSISSSGIQLRAFLPPFASMLSGSSSETRLAKKHIFNRSVIIVLFVCFVFTITALAALILCYIHKNKSH